MERNLSPLFIDIHACFGPINFLSAYLEQLSLCKDAESVGKKVAADNDTAANELRHLTQLLRGVLNAEPDIVEYAVAGDSQGNACTTLLVIDDQPNTARMLSQLAPAVNLALSGINATTMLELPNDTSVKFVLLDCMMQPKDGSLQERVGMLKQRYSNPVIYLMSGLALETILDAKQLIADGHVAGFIRKPVTLQHLKQLLPSPSAQ